MDSLVRFLDKIDCKFPYNDKISSHFLINEAKTLWEGALLGVLYELVNLPMSVNVSIERLGELMLQIQECFPQKYSFLFDIIMRKNKWEVIEPEDILYWMQLVKKNKDSIILLNILYSLDIDNCSKLVEEEYQRISQEFQ